MCKFVNVYVCVSMCIHLSLSMYTRTYLENPDAFNLSSSGKKRF